MVAENSGRARFATPIMRVGSGKQPGFRFPAPGGVHLKKGGLEPGAPLPGQSEQLAELEASPGPGSWQRRDWRSSAAGPECEKEGGRKGRQPGVISFMNLDPGGEGWMGSLV